MTSGCPKVLCSLTSGDSKAHCHVCRKHASALSSVSSGLRATAWKPRLTTRSAASSSVKPIGGFQLTQKKLADMTVELDKAFLLAMHLGRLKDDGALRPEMVSVGKLNNVRRGDRDGKRVAHNLGRQRHHAGVPSHASRQQPRVRPDL